MTMSGLNNSLYVDQMIEEARPSARDMKMAEAREAIWAARSPGPSAGPSARVAWQAPYLGEGDPAAPADRSSWP